MRPRLRRLAAAGTAVTVIDLTTLALGRATGLTVTAADAVAVAVAAAVSWPLHRRVSIGDDPRIRWVGQPRAYVGTALVAGAVDVAITGSLARHLPLAVSKAVGLGSAAALRLVVYRAILLTDVRRDLQARSVRPPAVGSCRFTVVVPAYRAESVIAETVRRLHGVLGADAEVLVVDDGSPDDTAVAARAAGATVLVLPANRGKGAAVRAGMLAARGQSIAFTDADLAYPPEQLLDLLTAVEEGWDVAVGNRWHPASTTAGRGPWLRLASSRLFNLLTATVLLGRYRDTQCGFKAFRSDVARQVFSRTRLDGFAFDVEVLHLVERDRLSMVEVPVRLVEDGTSTVRVRAAAPRMLADLFRVRRWASQGLYDREEGGQ